jgi:hypothetical protein
VIAIDDRTGCVAADPTFERCKVGVVRYVDAHHDQPEFAEHDLLAHVEGQAVESCGILTSDQHDQHGALRARVEVELDGAFARRRRRASDVRGVGQCARRRGRCFHVSANGAFGRCRQRLDRRRQRLDHLALERVGDLLHDGGVDGRCQIIRRGIGDLRLDRRGELFRDMVDDAVGDLVEQSVGCGILDSRGDDFAEVLLDLLLDRLDHGGGGGQGDNGHQQSGKSNERKMTLSVFHRDSNSRNASQCKHPVSSESTSGYSARRE